MDESIGYVVAVTNQASAQADLLQSDGLHLDISGAMYIARVCSEDRQQTGRRDRYTVCKVVPVVTWEQGRAESAS